MPTFLQVVPAWRTAATQGFGGSAATRFYGVLYAPHSNVEIVGNGQWYGAFVGNALRETGRSAVHYYRPLAGP